MSDQTSIFGNNTPASTNANDTNTSVTSNNANVQPNNDFADLLNQIKNERGEPKYKTIEDALKGLQHAQQYIPNIKTELEQRDAEIARLRAEAERAKTLEETLAALTSRQTQNDNTNQPVIDEKTIAELVNRQLTQAEQLKLAKANVASVVSTLQSAFGSDAEKKYNDAAAEAGLTVQEMNALAAKSPTAVLRMLGVNNQSAPQKQNTHFPSSSSVNTAALTPNNESAIGRNPKSALIGATTEDLREASNRAKKMVDELHAQGKTVHDLTDPKVFFKTFK
jgi:hypothetical protein